MDGTILSCVQTHHLDHTRPTNISIKFTSFVIAIFHIIVRPYQSNWLNTIDFLILCGIGFLSLFSGYTPKLIPIEGFYSLLWIGLLFPLIVIICQLFIISSFSKRMIEFKTCKGTKQLK